MFPLLFAEAAVGLLLLLMVKVGPLRELEENQILQSQL